MLKINQILSEERKFKNIKSNIFYSKMEYKHEFSAPTLLNKIGSLNERIEPFKNLPAPYCMNISCLNIFELR
jgi:hypothetical protein